jgi:hypothetical protein
VSPFPRRVRFDTARKGKGRADDIILDRHPPAGTLQVASDAMRPCQPESSSFEAGEWAFLSSLVVCFFCPPLSHQHPKI